MTDAVTTPPSHPAKDDDNLILDELSERLATLRILREDDPDGPWGRMLEEIGVRGKAEEDIVSQMADRKPLWRPDRFEEAHRLAMRSLEVLDRNGVRKVTVPRLGPLTPAAEWSTQQVTRFVVKNHQNTVIDRIRKLYERREANCDWESQDRRLLRRARYDAARVEPGYRGNAIGVPAFLLGGAALSGAFSAVQRTLRARARQQDPDRGVRDHRRRRFLGAAWSAIYGAPIARRRIRLALDQPLKALYETIGACGPPPQDQSTNFAIYRSACSSWPGS